MEIRKAEMQDLEQIMVLYEAARDFMVRTGNPRQWAARNWPPRELILRDIARGKSYVCTDEKGLAAVFYYDFGVDIDPTYRHIEEGRWLEDSPYGVVHRIAARAGSGAGKHCIRWAVDKSAHMRIDTHGDNRVMQKVLRDMGFVYCGIIHVKEDNDPRLAFEFIR